MADQAETRPQRADARRNYEHVLDVARAVIAEQGTEASLRDIARRADVGLGTLYRHFPTREALLEALLHQGFEALAERAIRLEAELPPLEALTAWLRLFVDGAGKHRGLPASILANLQDQASPLYQSCKAMRGAGGRLLEQAQAAGAIKTDLDIIDLFALMNSLAWVSDQATVFTERRDHLFGLIMDGLLRQPDR